MGLSTLRKTFRAAPRPMLLSPTSCHTSPAPACSSAATSLSIAGHVLRFSDGDIVRLILPNPEVRASSMLRIGVANCVA